MSFVRLAPVICLSSLSVVAPATAEPPAERRFAELMALTDAGDVERIAAYVRENFVEAMQRAVPGDSGIVAFLADHASRFGGF
ncbi:MAG TPA: hypothetical protein VD788_05575, partial [Candidatus Polarisedimenticolaceae bacterium]|nr:hypothetical protein [Candidatus Polarisedimenticolaceae bacterium]